jgi:hypothetical protein
MNIDSNNTHSTDREWVVVANVAGPLQAEILRGFLQAQGLTTVVLMEGAGRVHGLFVGPLGNNQVLVPDDQVERAEQLVEEYYAGNFEQVELEESDQEEPPENDGEEAEA